MGLDKTDFMLSSFIIYTFLGAHGILFSSHFSFCWLHFSVLGSALFIFSINRLQESFFALGVVFGLGLIFKHGGESPRTPGDWLASNCEKFGRSAFMATPTLLCLLFGFLSFGGNSTSCTDYVLGFSSDRFL